CAVFAPSSPPGIVGSAYSQTLAATGGLPPVSWSLASGSLPAGLTLGSNGAVSGTPLSAGSFSFVARATDSLSVNATQALTLAVNPALTITTDSLPSAVVGTGYSGALAATGGTGGYSWSRAAGSLPAGLSLTADGNIGGTPNAAGTANFTVQVKDSSNATVTKALSLTIVSPLTVTTSSLPNATVGTAYRQMLAASGGAGGYTWSIVKGSLPADLSRAADGTISGTPSAPGTSNFTIQVNDSSNATANKALGITVAAPPLTVTTSSLPNGTAGAAYDQTLAASGGTGGNSW